MIYSLKCYGCYMWRKQTPFLFCLLVSLNLSFLLSSYLLIRVICRFGLSFCITLPFCSESAFRMSYEGWWYSVSVLLGVFSWECGCDVKGEVGHSSLSSASSQQVWFRLSAVADLSQMWMVVCISPWLFHTLIPVTRTTPTPLCYW